MPRESYPSGTGPIYLSELECLGSESSLSSCQTGHNLPPGLVNCDHGMDVNVQCQGIATVIILLSIMELNHFILNQIMMSALIATVAVNKCATTLLVALSVTV